MGLSRGASREPINRRGSSSGALSYNSGRAVERLEGEGEGGVKGDGEDVAMTRPPGEWREGREGAGEVMGGTESRSSSVGGRLGVRHDRIPLC